MRVPDVTEIDRNHPGFELFVALNAESLPASFRLPAIGAPGTTWEKVLSTEDEWSGMGVTLESGAVATVGPNSLAVWRLTPPEDNGSRQN